MMIWSTTGERPKQRAGTKLSLSAAFSSIVIILALVSVLPVQASPRTIISSIYFNSDNSFVLEIEDRSQLEIKTIERVDDSSYRVVFDNAKIRAAVEDQIEGANFDLDITRSKSQDRGFLARKDLVEVTIRSKSGSSFEPKPRVVLEGLAYAIELEDAWRVVGSNTETEVEEESHHLHAQFNDHSIYSFNSDKGEAEIFLEKLDPKLADEIQNDIDFQDNTFRKVDSSSLAYLGETLAKRGHQDQAAGAYRRALSLDPENLNARLGLAKTSSDKQEQLDNYLASIDDRALLEIGSRWFDQGYKSGDEKIIARALISYQFAILHNPQDPESRFRYAQVLESSGADYVTQSAKRYLEAAALAKAQYQAGDYNVEPLLRQATESLIKVLVMQGKMDGAIKYCNSYLTLGFSKFLDGKSIGAVIKELQFNRNPFCNKGRACISSVDQLKDYKVSM